MSLTQSFSGIIINANGPATGTASIAAPVFTTFQLPIDYPRGTTDRVIPALSGLQAFVVIPPGDQVTATLTWELDVRINGVWTALLAGSSTGAAQTGNVWFNMLFDLPVSIDPLWLTNQFRFSIAGSGGITAANVSATGALLYRVLATTVDSGIDFLGDIYRSALTTTSPANVAADFAEYWLSQPNPSQFAVEALYFDMRTSDTLPVVIDAFTLDPLTPGVYFHLYYSNDANGPGTDPGSWDDLLWTPVYKTFQMTRMNTYALPEPILAKYVKVEFTQLQARPYNPGDFQIPCSFRKHPKWVLEFFLAQFALQELDLLSSSTTLTYDALDLAFSYHQGDIAQTADPPPQSLTAPNPLIQFISQANLADSVDPQTLTRIEIAFQPFLSSPNQLGDQQTMLGQYAASLATANYSTEIIQTALANTSIVSNLAREPLLVEKGFPVMWFFIPCRHGYRISQALFEKNIGYFAGVKSLTFHRDDYTLAADSIQYNEILGDGFNVLINDFA